MPPRLMTVIDRLRQDVAACLTPEVPEKACRQATHGRIEPRAVNRRPMSYPLLTRPRAELRKALLDKKGAASLRGILHPCPH